METEDDIDGSIHSIHVRNFFCHDNLEINLNRNINFIVGRNGSGKSAILTALVVGLGGRASATNRGSNLHSFIKKGTNSATIEIKLKNSSPKAYKPHLYGDYITIVRNINASGGSSYKVKSSSGEIISTKLEEVNAIVLAHDIQVDNPISVLNQDDARSFHASDSKKKYSLFRKATNLDQTETNYMRALENCNKANAIWNKKNEACRELEKEYKKWNMRHEQLQSKDEIEAHQQMLQNEYYWSEIVDLEKDATLVQNQYEKQKARLNQLVEKLNKMNQNYGNNNSVIQTLKSQLEERAVEKSALEQELRDLESQVRDVQLASRTAQAAANKQRELYNRESRKVNDLQTEIQNIDSGRIESRRGELESRLESARAAAEGIHMRYSTAQHEAEQAQANVAHASTQHESATTRAQNQRDKLKQLKQQLRELESRGNDSLAVYGNNMVELYQRVQQAVARGEFSAPPLGPVGAYLKVKDKKWGGALEHIIGGSIQTFCVNTPEDSRKMFEIMGQVYGKASKPGVTCSKFLGRAHDVRRHRVRANAFCSALDALQVQNADVTNFLVDNLALEKVLLVPNHDDAMRLAHKAENVPENCSKIVTLDCTEYHPAPHYRSYGGVARPSRFLQTSTAERKKQVRDEIDEAESVLRTLEEKAEELGAKAKQARDHERAAARALQALLAERHAKDEAVRVATAALEQQQAPQHAVLVEELDISKEKMRALSEQLESLTQKENQYKEKLNDCDATIRKVKNKLSQVATAYRSLTEEIDQEQLKLEQGVTQRQTCEQKIEEDKNKLAQVEAVLQEKDAVIKVKIEQALMLCPRIEHPRDKMLVTNELKKTQLKLSSIHSDGLSKADVTERLLEVKRKYLRTKQTLDRLRVLIDEIKKTTDKHLNFCRTMQTYIARRVQHSFQAILTLRGYSGSMRIDNAGGVLEILCTGRESAGKRHASTTSSLSGGERSYSTVAFIMALWECVELPFYFMDEFDVFMDNVNRQIVMDLLIDYAERNSARQFVFLTPQDASRVSASPKISIHLMADPRP